MPSRPGPPAAARKNPPGCRTGLFPDTRCTSACPYPRPDGTPACPAAWSRSSCRRIRFLLCLHFPAVLAPAAAAVSQLDISNQRGTKKPPRACPAPDCFFKGILAPPRILFKTENARSAPKFEEKRRGSSGSARPGSRAGAASVMPNRLYRAGGSRKGSGRRARAWSRWRGGRRCPRPR